MARDTLHLRASWQAVDPTPAAAVPPFVAQPLAGVDATELGDLIRQAFRGSTDDVHPTPQDAADEATTTLDGTWGAVIHAGSLVARQDDRLVSAVVVVLDDGHGGIPCWRSR